MSATSTLSVYVHNGHAVHELKKGQKWILYVTNMWLCILRKRKKAVIKPPFYSGGEDGIRTHDLLTASQAL